jgi:GNAT superfamily N-acetyltransferase
MTDDQTVDIRPEHLDSESVRTLLAALDIELYERYPEDGAVFTRLDGDEVGPGRGAMLVAYVDSEPAGCGAIRLLDPDRAEIKRMYVLPSMRGRGCGRALLDSLTDEARSLGATELVLETGERLVEAMSLYRRAGFVPVPCFGEYVGSPLSVCLGKELSRSS